MAILRMEQPSEPKDESTEGNSFLAAVARKQEQLAHIVPGLGSIASVRKEIDDALADMRMFHKSEPDSVMHAISGHSARLVEISVQIQRIEAVQREWRPVKDEAERVVSELRTQFSIASRLLAVRQQDFDMSRGGF